MRSSNRPPIFKKSIALAALAFFIVGMIFSSAFVPVHAFTNVFTSLNVVSCDSCANPVTLSGTLVTLNDLLVVSSECSTGNAISGITDTKLNSWALTTNAFLPTTPYTLHSLSPAQTSTVAMEIWFSSVGAAHGTGADTISVTYSSNNTGCVLELLEANTASISFSTGTKGLTTAPTLNNQAGVTSATASLSMPTNSIAFGIGNVWANAGVNINGKLSALAGGMNLITQAGFTTPGGANPCGGSCSGTSVSGYTYASTAATNTLGVTLDNNQAFTCEGAGCSTTGGTGSPIFFIVALFTQGGTLPGNGATVFKAGCTGNPVTATNKAFNVTANTAYYNAFYTNGQQQASIMTNFTVYVNSVHIPDQTFRTMHLELIAFLWPTTQPFNPTFGIPPGTLPNSGFPWTDATLFPATGVVGIALTANTTSLKAYTISGLVNRVGGGSAYAVGIEAWTYYLVGGVQTAFTGATFPITLASCSVTSPQLYFQTAPTNPGLQVLTSLTAANLASTSFGADMFSLINTPNIINTLTQTTTIATVTTVSTVTVSGTVTQVGGGINTVPLTSLNFWFIPMIFMMLGVGITTGIGEGVSKVQNAPLDGGIFMFLVMLGITLGSWFGTLSNVTPLGLSLLFTAITVIIAIRRT